MNKKTTSSFVIQELENLDIQTEEYNGHNQVYLPENLLDSSQWSLIEIICEEGDYDLTGYAGEFVDLYSYSSNRYYEEIQSNVWIVADETKVICVYFSTGLEGPVPGVFSIKDANLIKK
jgi:hypothetical protein